MCDATPGCAAFNSNGFLHRCAGGRCGCDAGAESCIRGEDIYTEDPDVNFGSTHTDMYVREGLPMPPEWRRAVAEGDAFYANPEPNPCYMPELGNGLLATVVGTNALFIAGLFNGRCGTVHKARLPSPLSARVVDANATLVASLLNLTSATFVRRWQLSPAGGGAVGPAAAGDDVGTIAGAGAGVGPPSVIVEQRLFVHRKRRNLLVAEYRLVGGGGAASRRAKATTAVQLAAMFNPAHDVAEGPGDGCAGSFDIDLAFAAGLPVDSPAPHKASLYSGRMLSASDAGQFFNVTIVADNVNGTVQLPAGGAPVRFLATVVSSLDQPDNRGSAQSLEALAQSLHVSASAVPMDALAAEHSSAWAGLRSAGIEVMPNSSSAEAVRRAMDVASHINSSTYYLLSSVRDDHYAGISPGGIASASYQGAVFMDMDMWMGPAMYMTHPELVRSTLEYRYISLNASRNLAALAGYQGAMYAWTAAYQGNAFGCCSMHGSYENCLEQHVTGDVAVHAWQYYAATGDREWLASRGMPLLEAIADFHMSRVTKRGAGVYSIDGVLPIDEWCVGSGCGCESPGVDNDAQMNAVALLSLRFAAQAAIELGLKANATRWLEVSRGVPLLFNETAGRHEQFTSQQCPGGKGGTHYTSRHTVCPEDVLLLTYPLGE